MEWSFGSMHSYSMHYMEMSMQHQAPMSLSVENEPPAPIWETDLGDSARREVLLPRIYPRY